MIDYKNKVLQIVDYIESNIKKNICLDSLVDQFNISKFHMSRTFKQITGDTLAKYIKGRKLAVSLDYLLNHDYNIIDIAMLFGFDYEQSYIRAFKSEFSITPHQYRKNQGLLNVTQKLSLSDLLIFEDGILLPPEKVFLPELYLVGKEYYIDSSNENYLINANKVGVNFLTKDSNRIKGNIDKSVYYSIVKNLELDRGDFSYMPSVAFKGRITYPEDMALNYFPSSEYIHFKYIGEHSPYVTDMIRLKDIHHYIKENLSFYLEEKCSPGIKIERIVEDKCSDTHCEMDFFYPLKKLFN